MRKIFLFLSVLLLGLSWALAQNSTSSAKSSTAAGQTSHASASGQASVEGCLSGSNGSYALTDKNGTTYQLTGDTAKLSEHVGHEVRITGTRSSATSDTGTGTASSTAAGAG